MATYFSVLAWRIPGTGEPGGLPTLCGHDWNDLAVAGQWARVLLIKMRFSDYGCQGEGWREGTVREFGMDVYTLLYLKWIGNKDLRYSTHNSAQYYGAAWMGGELGGERIHVYVWLSPSAVHLKLPQHCLLIGYTPIQNFLKNAVLRAEASLPPQCNHH